MTGWYRRSLRYAKLFCLKGQSRRLKDDTVSVLTDSLHTSAHRTVHSITARKEEKKSIKAHYTN